MLSEIVYDHYKETCIICREQVKRRNSEFVKMYLFLMLVFVISTESSGFFYFLNSYTLTTYNISITFSTNIVSTFIWILLLYYTLNYYRSCINLERQYSYVHLLEGSINSILHEENKKINFLDINRESKSYLNNYPKALDISNNIYKIFLPLIYIGIIGVGIRQILLEINWTYSNLNILKLVQILIACICIYLTVLFLKENN